LGVEGITIQAIRRGPRIVWREIKLTFWYGGSRRGDIVFGLSTLFFYKAVSEFFAQPSYEGQFVSSFFFTAGAVLAYVVVVTSLLRARAARRKRKQEQQAIPGVSAINSSRLDD